MSDSILEALDATGTEYQVIECDPELADTAEFCSHYGYKLDESANAIMVMAKSKPRRYAMCLVLATTQVNVNKTVRKRFGVKKASFAPPEQTAELTGMTLGGVTPIGLPDDLPLWIDAKVMDCSRVIIGGGSRDRKIYLPPEDLLALPNTEVVAELSKERPPKP